MSPLRIVGWSPTWAMILAPRRKAVFRTTLVILTVTPLIAAIATLPGCGSTRELSPSTIVNVHGVIRDREGIGVPGVRVCLDPADDGRSTYTTAVTDRNGTYHLRVGKGPYFWFLDPSHARIPPTDRSPILLTKSDERLDYRYAGLKVQGRIVGPNGFPMKAGIVRIIGEMAYRGFSRDFSVEGNVENGRYSLFLPASMYSFYTSPWPTRYPAIEGGYRARISADTTIDFKASGHHVAGRATFGRSRPWRDVEVRVSGKVDGLYITAGDRINSHGRFELFLPNGIYGLTVNPGRKVRNVAWRTFPLVVNGPQSLALDLSGVTWRGTVRDSTTRAPLRFVNVVAKSGQFASGLECKSDKRGRFMFVLEPGRVYALGVGQGPVNGATAINDSTIDLYVGRAGGLTPGLR